MKNANSSNDQQTIKMMNDTLGQHQYSDGGKNATVSDAVSDLYGDGFDLSAKHTYSSGYHYVYNQSKDQMVLLDGSWNAVYPDNSSVGSDTWTFYYGKGEDVSASVNNYFSFQNVLATDVNMFPSNSVIDLNGYLCYAQTQVGAISLQNGFTYTGWTKKSGCTDIVENNVATSSANLTYTFYFKNSDGKIIGTQDVVVKVNFAA